MSPSSGDEYPAQGRRSRRQLLRLMALGTAGAGAAALLAACGASTTTTGATSSAAAPAASSSAAASSPASSSAAGSSSAAASAPAPTPTLAPAAHVGSGGTEIRWQFRGSPDNLKAAQDTLTKSFVPKNANIKVTIEPAPDNRDEKLIAQMVAGTAPDVFETWGDNVQQYAEKGQVTDVNTLVAQNKVDTSDFYAWQWRDFNIPINGGPNGGGSQMRFGLPKYVNVMVLWVNKDMFQAKGVDLPTLDWTHDDYANAITKLAVKDQGKIKVGGAWIPMNSWDRYWYRVAMWGGDDANAQDPTKCDLGEKPAQDAFEWARKLAYDDQVLLTTQSGLAQVQGDRFFNGQFAISEDGFYPFQMAKNNATAKINWQYAHVPKGPVTRKVLGTTDGFSMWKQTPHQPEAWTLLQYLAGVDYQTAQVESTGLLPVRTSVLNNWKTICTQKYPELANANLTVGADAMTMGYPGNRNFFKNTTAAQELIVPALQKVFDVGKTPVTYFQQVASQVTQTEKSG